PLSAAASANRRRVPLMTDPRPRRGSGISEILRPVSGRTVPADRGPMPIADHATYCEMFDRARKGGVAHPAINVTSLTTANGVLRGLAAARSDGIIQVSTGGAAFASGGTVKDMVLGAITIAEHVHRVADRYPIYVALHTDHCQAQKLDSFV